MTKPREGRWFWLSAFVLLNVAGFLLASYRILSDMVDGGGPSPSVRFAEEMGGAYAALLLLPMIVAIHRRFPFERQRLGRTIAAHGVGLAVYSVLHTGLLSLVHGCAYTWVGLAQDSFRPTWHLRLGQELAHDVIGYAVCVSAITLWHWAAELRHRAVRTAQLERALADAQLRSLRLQLQPHFLFNALNTISAAVYEDPQAADRMIEHLAALLRAALENVPTHEVPLAQELEVLGRYTALLEARFGDRLSVRVDVAQDAARARVPSLLLQPLVENVWRHGVAVSTRPVHVDVRARLEAGNLAIEIEDDGPGATAATSRTGIGLSSSVERLRLLYGERAQLLSGTRSEGGFRVHMRLPVATEPT